MDKIYLPLKENQEGLTHLKLTKYYAKGGFNYFSGKTDLRGIYLSVLPVKREDRGNCVVESFTVLGNNGGLRKNILEQKRHNQKALDAINLTKEAQPLIENVLLNCQLELQEQSLTN